VLAAVAIACLLERTTGSRTAAVTAAALFVLNPNLLYLQATPMTEPLLIGLMLAAVATLATDIDGAHSPGSRTWTIGVLCALACLTRYEAWPVTIAAIVIGGWARWRTGYTIGAACRYSATLALAPAIAVGAFFVFSRIAVGAWFVSGGFFVPQARSLGHPSIVIGDMVWGIRALGGTAIVVAGLIGLGIGLIRGLTDRPGQLLGLSLLTTAALPFAAFLDGHPYRIRYMVPLLCVTAIGCGYLVAASKRAGAAVAAALLMVTVVERPPLDTHAAMVEEAKWDVPNVARRLAITEYLRSRYRGETVMASMGSLGHYMQELSDAGLDVHDFLHEGNGDVWLRALNGHPERFVGWMLIDEQGEGGDMLAKAAREHPEFLDGFSRVTQAAGIALYERQNRTLNVAR